MCHTSTPDQAQPEDQSKVAQIDSAVSEYLDKAVSYKSLVANMQKRQEEISVLLEQLPELIDGIKQASAEVDRLRAEASSGQESDALQRAYDRLNSANGALQRVELLMGHAAVAISRLNTLKFERISKLGDASKKMKLAFQLEIPQT